MLKVAIGQSEDILAEEAVNEVLEQIHSTLGDLNPQAGILFCPLDFDHSYIISKIRLSFPLIELVGCTADGELSSKYGFTEDSLVLMVFASDTIEIHSGLGKNTSQDGIEAGREAASSARKKLKNTQGEERFAIILSDPLNAGVSNVSYGIAEILGDTFPLFGAASAAHSKKRTTYQFFNDEIVTDSIVLLLFSGPILFSWGIQGGHSPMGKKERVTSSNKNVLYRIGDEPALDYFRRYIGESYDLFMNYCLAIFEEGRESFYVRSAPFCDPETGNVTLNGIVSENCWVQIGTVDKSTCIESCEKSLCMALDGYPGSKPTAAIHFSCAGRKIIMGTQITKEANTVKEYLKDIPFCGFYAYGEFGPLQKGSRSLFHGTTFVTLLIGTE
jgi:hypothetical protein